MSDVPILSLKQSDFSAQIGASFCEFGFAIVCDHDLDEQVVENGWDHTKTLFSMTENEKLKFFDPKGGGARGYTPFGKEIAKDASHHDLKEFWHIGRDLPERHRFAEVMPANIWPTAPANFQSDIQSLFNEFDRVGNVLLTHIAEFLGLKSDWFANAVEDGNSVLRLLHYPPIASTEGCIRAGAHEDINLITLLLGAEEAGLEILSNDGQWLAVDPPKSALVVNVGDMLQRLTNHKLPSTTHRVVNPTGDRSKHSRYSMPYFLHLRPDFLIETLADCSSSSVPNKYAEPILAHDFLLQRLKEIGLI